MDRGWNPDRKVRGYAGPYPVRELEDARQTLVDCLKYPDSEVLARTIPKVGISNGYGRGMVPPPIFKPNNMPPYHSPWILNLPQPPAYVIDNLHQGNYRTCNISVSCSNSTITRHQESTENNELESPVYFSNMQYNEKKQVLRPTPHVRKHHDFDNPSNQFDAKRKLFKGDVFSNGKKVPSSESQYSQIQNVSLENNDNSGHDKSFNGIDLTSIDLQQLKEITESVKNLDGNSCTPSKQETQISSVTLESIDFDKLKEISLNISKLGKTVKSNETVDETGTSDTQSDKAGFCEQMEHSSDSFHDSSNEQHSIEDYPETNVISNIRDKLDFEHTLDTITASVEKSGHLDSISKENKVSDQEIKNPVCDKDKESASCDVMHSSENSSFSKLDVSDMIDYDHLKAIAASVALLKDKKINSNSHSAEKVKESGEIASGVSLLDNKEQNNLLHSSKDCNKTVANTALLENTNDNDNLLHSYEIDNEEMNDESSAWDVIPLEESENFDDIDSSKTPSIVEHNKNDTNCETMSHIENLEMNCQSHNSKKLKVDDKLNPSFANNLNKINEVRIWKPTGHLCGLSGNAISIIKCDTCNYCSYDVCDVEHHLKEAVHYSASKYKAILASHECVLELVCVQDISVVINQSAYLHSQVVACPVCSNIFEDVHMCGIHSQREHGTEHGAFSVCSVINKVDVTLFSKPKCDLCGDKYFSSQRELNCHWKEEPSHNPFKTSGMESFALYFCGADNCKTVIYRNEGLAISHAILHINVSHNKVLKKQINSVTVVMKEFLQPRKQILLPRFDTENRNGLQFELEVLKNMHSFYNNVLKCGKQRIKSIKERIDAVKNALKCT